jgi:hypothetical protein
MILCIVSSTNSLWESLYTECYGCKGTNEKKEFGCLLCETYGDRCGYLLKQYRNQKLTIGNETFTPPIWKCLYCQDTKLGNYPVFLDSFTKSDFARWNLPKVRVACHSCCAIRHSKEYSQAVSQI